MEKNNKTVGDYTYWVKIVVYSGKYPNSTIKCVLSWENLPFQVRTKWHWYFIYRNALAQVQNPKCLVSFNFGKTEINNDSPIQVRFNLTSAKLKSSRKMLTQYKNAIARYEEAQKVVLIPDFQNPKYLAAKSKIDFYESEILRLTQELQLL